MHSQGGETSIQDSYSRWGVKGSNEVSEGLTAVYRYEEGLDLATTTLSDNNRLSYVGLSGGFGTVTMGRIWSASYNHLGALTDTGIHNAPNTSTSSRTSNALSYSASTGPVSFQIDANMNAKEESKRSVDMAQLGMSFDTGAAKIGLAFVNSKSESDSTRMSGIGVSVPVGGLTLYSSWTEKKVTTFATPGTPGKDATPPRCQVVRYANATFGTKIETDTNDKPLYWKTEPPSDGSARASSDEKSTEVTNWPVLVEDRNKVIRDPNAQGNNDVLKIPKSDPGPEVYRETTGRTWNSNKGVYDYKCGSSSSGTQNVEGNPVPFIAERTFQSATAAVEADPDDPAIEEDKSMKSRHMHAGVSGPLGDTGMSFAVNVANHPDSKDGIGENPWNFNVSKSLGGGASLAFEYVDYDKRYDNEALLRLKVDF